MPSPQIKLLSATLSFLLCTIPGFSAYTENGKPVTKRNPVILSSPDQEAPIKTSNKESNDAPAESEKNTSPTDTIEPNATLQAPPETPEELPPPQDMSDKGKSANSEKKPMPPPKSNLILSFPTVPKETPSASEAVLTAHGEKLPQAETVKEKSDSASIASPELSTSAAPAEEPSPKASESQKERNRHTFILSGFAGMGKIAEDIDVEFGGTSLEYRYVLNDGRCDSCDLGNRWLLSLRLGYGQGKGDNSASSYWHEYSYDDVSRCFLTAGLLWQHQLSQSVSLMFGASVGVEYVSVKYSTVDYRYWNDWNETSDTVSDFSLCAGASASLCFEFRKNHSIEIGAEIYYSNSDFEDGAPRWENNQVYGLVKIGYGYHF